MNATPLIPASPSDPPSVSHAPETSPSLGWVLWHSLWPLLVGIGIALSLHFGLPKVLNAYWIGIVRDIGIAMLMAVSLNIVNGMTGQFSIGHAGFLAVGGYTAAMITYYGSLAIWGSSARHGGFLGSGEWLFCVACFAGGLVAAGLGYLVGLPSLRLRGDYLAIVTLGFGEIVRVLLQQTNPVLRSWSDVQSASWKQLIPPPVGGAIGFNGVPKYTNIFWVFAWLAITVVCAWRLKHSSLGRAMISVREDEIAARAMGVNVTRQKVWAFILAAFFAGCGGGLSAHISSFNIAPTDAGFLRSFDYIIMVVLGGSGSITGSMLSAAVLTWLPQALIQLKDYRNIAFASLLIGMMLLRPQGLFGFREIWELPWIVALKTRLFGKRDAAPRTEARQEGKGV